MWRQKFNYQIWEPNESKQRSSWQTTTKATKETTKGNLFQWQNCKSKRLKTAYEKQTQKDSKETALEFEEGKRQLDKAYGEAKAEFLDKKLQEIESASFSQQHKKSWKLINNISGRKRSRSGHLKGKTKEERAENWYVHFKQLLGNPPVVLQISVFNELPIRCDAFDRVEFQKAKQLIKEG